MLEEGAADTLINAVDRRRCSTYVEPNLSTPVPRILSGTRSRSKGGSCDLLSVARRGSAAGHRVGSQQLGDCRVPCRSASRSSDPTSRLRWKNCVRAPVRHRRYAVARGWLAGASRPNNVANRNLLVVAPLLRTRGRKSLTMFDPYSGPSSTSRWRVLRGDRIIPGFPAHPVSHCLAKRPKVPWFVQCPVRMPSATRSPPKRRLRDPIPNRLARSAVVPADRGQESSLLHCDDRNFLVQIACRVAAERKCAVQIWMAEQAGSAMCFRDGTLAIEGSYSGDLAGARSKTTRAPLKN